jgi:hypothetical protein
LVYISFLEAEENEQGTYQGQEERAREMTKIWSKEKDKFWEGLSGAGEETTDKF